MTKNFRILLAVTTCLSVPFSLSAVQNWKKLHEEVNHNHKSAHKFRGYKSTSDETKEFLASMKESHTKLHLQHSPSKEESSHFLHMTAPKIPTSFDLSQYTTIFDQGPLGSCTGNSLVGALFARQLKELSEANPKTALPTLKVNVHPASRLFVYYGERQLEGTVNEDSGASIGDGIKFIHTTGAPDETVWPYDVSKFAIKPPVTAWTQAYSHKALDPNYMTHDAIIPSVTGLNALKLAISSGDLISLGIAVYDSFESDQVAKTGVVPIPDVKKESLLGGHAVLALGYDDKTQLIKCANSWGTSWGDKGYFYLPYKYFEDSSLTDEAWIISTVQKPNVVIKK
ncbi:C1 family peptidase [Candidatus Bealeia paramacronuclearis]|uniref:C1 family peptidase n=1 Tax=Candidatus Bealeia paramacronuclearis TaxID=1921001 RepID=A0ABZ2C365_9PROT|nr:C1 family peptidase [Candidatus Bealeia paramacronuclearis]